MKKKAEVKYQIGEEDGEVIRKTLMRHSEYKGRKDVIEDIVKRIRTEFHTEYTRQGNFTICGLISDNAVIPGVAKRNPRDKENMEIGNTVALSQAVKNWLAS